MGDFADTAVAILSASEWRLEVSGQNIANMTTPGYKRRISFESILSGPADNQSQPPSIDVTRDFSAGKVMDTGNPDDLALTHNGFFLVTSPHGQVYTRQGSFHRDSDGRLVTAQGWPVQAEGGGDIVLKDGDFKIDPDGAITKDGQPVAKLAVMDFAGPKVFADAQDGYLTADGSNMTPVEAPGIRQGALESSNVSTGSEMVAMMEALRRAEAAQRLITVYDDLMGRALSTFGQS